MKQIKHLLIPLLSFLLVGCVDPIPLTDWTAADKALFNEHLKGQELPFYAFTSYRFTPGEKENSLILSVANNAVETSAYNTILVDDGFVFELASLSYRKTVPYQDTTLKFDIGVSSNSSEYLYAASVTVNTIVGGDGIIPIIDGKKSVDFYAINDFHGAVEYLPQSSEPGINKLGAYYTMEKTMKPVSSVFFSSGDMFQGSADSNLTRGALVTDAMNEMEIEAMTIGNHEFDWGVGVLNENIARADFPFLACNIRDIARDEYVLGEPYTILEREDGAFKIGIIGAIGQGLTNSILASSVQGLEFVDPTPIIADIATNLRADGVQMIVASIHNGEVDDRLAAYVDAVFLGHDHRVHEETISYDGKTIPVLEGGYNGRGLAKLTLNYDVETHVVTASNEEIVNVFSMGLDDDPDVKAIYDYYYETVIKDIKEEVLGTANNNVSNSQILDFTLEEMYKKYKLQDSSLGASFHNAGGVRAPIDAGVITYGDLCRSLPFDNQLYLVKAKGAVLNEMSTYGDSYSTIGQINSNTIYTAIVISYVFEKIRISDNPSASNYATYTVIDDFPRDVVADALRANPNAFN
ncbi:MAG: 5'-nucleotidase C-terminal domain-containing protein [Erysipelotrichaceae bacterium]|nr:5'-nucleotidase C-terminal domain-containing protein [Erysipelotrichaceae bacterium]